MKKKIKLSEFVRQYFQAGGKILQYRDKSNSYFHYLKNLHAIYEIAHNYKDSIVIANEFHREVLVENFSNTILGFHFGQEDIQQGSIYKQCQKKGYIVGISTHSIIEVNLTKKLFPNYIGFGSVFQSQTKPNISVLSATTIKKIIFSTTIPIVLIGGITQKNIFQLPKASHVYYAIVSDMYTYNNQIDTYVQKWKTKK